MVKVVDPKASAVPAEQIVDVKEPVAGLAQEVVIVLVVEIQIVEVKKDVAGVEHVLHAL